MELRPLTRSVLLIEPDPGMRDRIARILEGAGYRATPLLARGGLPPPSATRGHDVVLATPDWSSPDLAEWTSLLRAAVGITPLVLLCPASRVEVAARLLGSGADDYLLRPPDPVELASRLTRLLERSDLDSRVAVLQDELSKRAAYRNLEARSPSMALALERVMRVAPMRSTVLILGESGVGKELVARAIHFNSPRRDGPFLALNCAAIPSSLIESELFGHEKGSFTGAHARMRGKFEIAHGGTLFLDEIGEMDGATQVKLLRVLEEREFMRIGGERSVRVDVRVIAATNADLSGLVAQGRFRQDLYYRLKVVTIDVPPLRERGADLPALVETFLDELSRTNAVPRKSISAEALSTLCSYQWPGNVRELKNVLESLLVSAPGDVIRLEDLPPSVRHDGAPGPPAEFPPGTSLAQLERELIRRTLESTGGNRTHSASLLGIGVRTLQRKILTYGLAIAPKRRRPRRSSAPARS